MRHSKNLVFVAKPASTTENGGSHDFMTHHFHLSKFYTLFNYYDFICGTTPDDAYTKKGFFRYLPSLLWGR